jgi:hypothetical protein
MEWKQTYGGSRRDKASSLVATSDGGYALAGYTESFGAGNRDFWLIKTDESGNLEWDRTYGGPGYEMAHSVVETPDGGYALAGGTLLVKTDKFGNMEWNQTYERSSSSLVAMPDGGYVMSMGKYLVKVDEFGNMKWNQTCEGSIESLVATDDGGYAMMISSKASWGFGYFRPTFFWLVKTDEFGNMEWNQTYGSAMYGNVSYSLLGTTFDGGYVLAGYTTRSVTESVDILLVKSDAAGNREWNQTYGGVDNDYPHSLVATSDGGYVIAGEPSSNSKDDFLVVKVDEYGIGPEFPVPNTNSKLFVTVTAIAVATVVVLLYLARIRMKKSKQLELTAFQ